MQNMSEEKIHQHLDYRNGDVRIVGTSYKARVVASIHLHGNLSIEEVAEEFEISVAQVYAALAYYYDNYEAFEAERNAPRRFAVDAEDNIAKFKARMDKKQNNPKR